MRDGSFSTISVNNISQGHNVYVVIPYKGKILSLVRPSDYKIKNLKDLPGGKAESDEKILQTAEREVLEETGRKLKSAKYLGRFYSYRNGKYHKNVLLEGKLDVPLKEDVLEKKLVLSDEHQSWKLIDLNNLSRYKMSHDFKRAIFENYLN
ncbi:NUDIX hydrolase [Candidatus Woesearchaeota archaeon]|nr:NUDIX hydrolase [Candidatus Woesearchaeota archaeon]